MSVTTFTIIVLIAYLVGIKVISYFAHRVSTGSSEDYFLVSRNIGLLALIGTTMASIFSTDTVVASPANFFKNGTGFFWVFFFALMPVMYFFFATKLCALGRVKGYITPGDMLGDFYQSKAVKLWAGVIGILSLCPYAIAQLVAVGKTFEALTDGVIPYAWGVRSWRRRLPSTCTLVGLERWYGRIWRRASFLRRCSLSPVFWRCSGPAGGR